MILVHRLLKNAVPVEEYILLTEELFGASDGEIRDRASSVDQELEGLGLVRAYFVDLAEIAEPLQAVSVPGPVARVAFTMRTIMAGAPYVMGFRRLPPRTH